MQTAMSTLNNAPIAVFDSGVGGLTVLKALWQALPQESFIYLADTARIPYGTKSQETVEEYARQICAKLIDEHAIKALVIACNTASAHALPALTAQFPDLPILGVIVPGARKAIAVTRNQHIAVIATEGTVHHQAYEKAIKALNPKIKVVSQACTLLVALAEEGWIEGEISDRIIQRYLQPLFAHPPAERPDTLVLGCTHFPLLRQGIEHYLGKDITVIDSASTTAEALIALLQKHHLETQSLTADTQFLVTDSPQRFILTAALFLGKTLNENKVMHISLN